MSNIVVLTNREIMMGAIQGVLRQVKDISTGYKGYHQQPKHLEWQVKIEGALAEEAVSKYLGVYWSGVTKRGADDTVGYEIRMTHLPHGKLCIYKYDPDDTKFILAAGLNGTYNVAGWYFARDGKIDKYIYDKDPVREPCWMVPQGDLHPMDTLDDY